MIRLNYAVRNCTCQVVTHYFLFEKEEGNENVENLALDTKAALGKFKGAQVKAEGLGQCLL